MREFIEILLVIIISCLIASYLFNVSAERVFFYHGGILVGCYFHKFYMPTSAR